MQSTTINVGGQFLWDCAGTFCLFFGIAYQRQGYCIQIHYSVQVNKPILQAK
jgi:hypothetical protein